MTNQKKKNYGQVSLKSELQSSSVTRSRWCEGSVTCTTHHGSRTDRPQSVEGGSWYIFFLRMGVRGTGLHLVAAVKWLGGDVRACAFASCRAHQRQELFRGGALGGAARAKLHAQVHRVQTHLKHSTTTMCRRRHTFMSKGFTYKKVTRCTTHQCATK